jgi:hypothetical protein
MKLKDIFNSSSATIFDYARGIFGYTRKQQADIDEIREGLRQEGVNLPRGDNDGGKKPGDDK